MLDFDSSRLRAQVIRDFESFARGAADADAMSGFANAVMANATGTIRDRLNAANWSSIVGHIPPEILAACFAHLSFRCRIGVSHVCQQWRAAALSAPELWSDIAPWVPFKHSNLLQMALSRAGNRPINLKIDARAPNAPQAMYDVISPFSQKLRYLAWHSEHPASLWDFPAPNLECFWSSTSLLINDDFLDGQAGRLRCLYLGCVDIPTVCPALSTVSELRVALTSHEDELPSNLENLFTLFPRLEFLHIRGITHLTADLLPSGPAPTSLRELWLQSRSWVYDLTPHYLAWNSGTLQHVSLTQYPGVHPNLAHMASGTVRLAVNHVSDEVDTRLMFEHSAKTSHSITVRELGISNAAALLAAVQSHLTDVHTVMVSHVALGALIGLLNVLPKLEHLFVHIVPKDERGSHPPVRQHTFVWTYLSCLSGLVDGVRVLRAITLHVWCGEDRQSSFAKAQHARELISQLRALPGSLPPIEVQGFPADQVESLDLTGLNIRFDASAKVGDLILHEHPKAYNPFRYQPESY